MQGAKIKVIVKEPSVGPVVAEIENELEEFQKIVGGNIESVPLFEDFTAICNEEGRLQSLPWCCEILGINFVGTVVFVGVDGEQFADIPISYKQLKQCMPWLWTE